MKFSGFFLSLDLKSKSSYNFVAMDSNEAFSKILHSFERYYNLKTEDVESPFLAEATFKSHSEQYFLIKSAKLSESDSNEFVFFSKDGDIPSLASLAWERGLSRVTPYYGHRNTDITFIYVSDKIPDDSFKKLRKLNFYKSYKFGFYGWSSFRALAYEASTGRFSTNRRGSDLKKIAGSL